MLTSKEIRALIKAEKLRLKEEKQQASEDESSVSDELEVCSIASIESESSVKKGGGGGGGGDDEQMSNFLEHTSMEESAAAVSEEEGETSEVEEMEIDGITYLYDESGDVAGVEHLLMTEDGEPIGVLDVETGQVMLKDFSFE